MKVIVSGDQTWGVWKVQIGHMKKGARPPYHHLYYSKMSPYSHLPGFIGGMIYKMADGGRKSLGLGLKRN